MTDFEQYGLSRGPVKVVGRHLLLTVDFEAFQPSMVPLWCKFMHYWAELAQRYGLRFCFFVAVEDIVNLRAKDASLYAEFSQCIKALSKAGTFYPHNHCVFDPKGGGRPNALSEPGERPPGYTKRESMFSDVVYRQGLSFSAWIRTVREVYEEFLGDADVEVPINLAFRAGGWDYGSSQEDLRQYVDGLSSAGFRIDSSACSGAFGTESWQVGAPFGHNIFQLSAPSLVEMAACWSLDCGADFKLFSHTSLGYLRQLRRQPNLWHPMHPGAFVIVIHFDHLFHENRNGSYEYFCVTDFDTVAKRIDRFFYQLSIWRASFRLRSTTFDELELTADLLS